MVNCEAELLQNLGKIKGHMADLKRVGGDIEAVAEMIKPREMQVLAPDARN